MRRKYYFSAIFFLTTNSEFKMMCDTSIVIILVNRDDIDGNVPAMKLTTGIWMGGKALRVDLMVLKGRNSRAAHSHASLRYLIGTAASGMQLRQITY
jgi:hypothetical protein